MLNRHRRRRPLLARLPLLARQAVAVRQARRRVAAPPQLPLLSIETTVDCNARCRMCSFPTSYPAGDRGLSTSELCEVVDEAALLGTQVISLGGGEPLLREDLVELVHHIDGQAITPFVHTNGSLLDRERCRALAELSGLILAISLDSHRRSTHRELRALDCFDSAIQAARFFITGAPHVRVAFTFTITRANFRDMVPVLALARDIGVRAVRFTPVHHNLQHRFRPAAETADLELGADLTGALAAEIERVIQFARSHRMISNSTEFLRAIPASTGARIAHQCFAGFFFCSIDPYGRVFPCYDHIGDVDLRRHGGLETGFRSPEMDLLRQRVVDCQNPCWNVGTAEPSLRLNRKLLLRQAPHLLRESRFFLP